MSRLRSRKPSCANALVAVSTASNAVTRRNQLPPRTFASRLPCWTPPKSNTALPLQCPGAMQSDLLQRTAERALLVLFLAWLIWLPMPFGSVIERARLPLIAVPLALCALAALVSRLPEGRAWRIWTGGSLLFLAIVALQLVPLPMLLLRALSPHAAELWEGSDRVRQAAASSHP